MTDIVSVFPLASAVRENGKDNFSLYLFEEELRSILRLIGWAAGRGYRNVQISDLSDEAKDFLIEKGYKVNAEDKKWWIEWGE